MTVFGFGSDITRFKLARLKWKPSKDPSKGATWQVDEDTFTSDATVNESYNFMSDIPKFPVQGGYPVTDMAGTNSVTVTITAVNSNATHGVLDLITDNAFANSPLGTVFGYETSVQKAYDKLERWAANGTPLQLKCVYAQEGYKEKNGDIAPFLIGNLSIIRNADTGDSIGYTCTLERVFISQTTVIVRQDVIDTKDKGELGITNTKTGEVVEELEPITALKEGDLAKPTLTGDNILDWLGGLFGIAK